MKVKEIKELEVEKLHLVNDWELLDLLKDGVKISDFKDDDEFISISEYLEFIIEIRELSSEAMKIDYNYEEMEENF